MVPGGENQSVITINEPIGITASAIVINITAGKAILSSESQVKQWFLYGSISTLIHAELFGSGLSRIETEPKFQYFVRTFVNLKF